MRTEEGLTEAADLDGQGLPLQDFRNSSGSLAILQSAAIIFGET
jgi:hypothetical protein